MHSIRVEIQDGVFDKVICFLNNLPVNEVKIIDDATTSKETRKLIFNSIGLHTKDFKFDREEANAR